MNEPTDVVEVLQALQRLLDPGSTVVTVEFDPAVRQHVARLEYRFTAPADQSDEEVQAHSGSILRSLIGLD
jgi:hypothetical protein